jgi:predicted Zn-dependent protease
MQHYKSFLPRALILCTLFFGGCSTNPATGNRQFTALMSPAQEIQIGASEHQKIVKQYGLVDDPKLKAYVEEAGRKVTVDTERPDVEYKFFILDSPIVNAFALPGGYIYISRGLLALANSEAEMASVLGHEAGHITGRHSAERYSRGVVTTLGASILSAAIGSAGASQAIGLGTNLYLSS